MNFLDFLNEDRIFNVDQMPMKWLSDKDLTSNRNGLPGIG